VTAVAAAAAVTLPLAAASSINAEGASPDLGVIVQEFDGTGNGPENAVARLGGSVTRQIPLIHGFAAKIPGTAMAALRGTRGVRAVTLDRRVQLSTPIDGWNPSEDAGSLETTAKITGATRFWRHGQTGKGIDVAVIDSGVAPVEGLDDEDKLVYGPDLSFESQHDNLRYLDTFGHGTHMAGIIAGRDTQSHRRRSHRREPSGFVGIAPGARIVSVKVADRVGAADVSQVIAAIDWVVQHRNSGGLNIRVLNLSFGTDGVQDYRIDPLAFAAEVAWRKGIVVVVAGGNAGYGSPKLNNPAYDPYVIAVGASDPKGTITRADDEVPAWSSAGDGLRNPDLVAPGKSIVSLRVPGSGIDTIAPGGRVGERFFRGSGTSQAAAVVSGSVALLLDQRPRLKPDQVKAILKGTADRLPNAADRSEGAGMLDLGDAHWNRTPSLADVAQTWELSTGTGSLNAARGTQILEADGVKLDGETDIFGQSWNGSAWTADMWNGSAWTGGVWNGSAWTGSAWTGSAWTGSAWTGSAWTGSAWTGSAWTGSAWTGSAWTGSAWTGSAWTGSAWTGSAWTGSAWTGGAWTGSAWTGSAWTGSAWTGSAWTGSAWTGSAWTGSAWSSAGWGS
jgi:serine protease AprX